MILHEDFKEFDKISAKATTIDFLGIWGLTFKSLY